MVSIVIILLLLFMTVSISCEEEPSPQPAPAPTQPSDTETPSEPTPIKPETEIAPTSKLPPAIMPVPPSEPPASINPAAFLHIGDLAAVNSEVTIVEAAAAAYYAFNGSWPSNTYKDLVEGGFISKLPVYDYTFDSFGHVVVPDGAVFPNDSSIIWSAAEHKWH